jgi:hypothetical protein
MLAPRANTGWPAKPRHSESAVYSPSPFGGADHTRVFDPARTNYETSLGTTKPIASTPVSIPEPAPLILLGTGLITLACALRFRKT